MLKDIEAVINMYKHRTIAVCIECIYAYILCIYEGNGSSRRQVVSQGFTHMISYFRERNTQENFRVYACLVLDSHGYVL